jgi:hypothetical protein
LPEITPRRKHIPDGTELITQHAPSHSAHLSAITLAKIDQARRKQRAKPYSKRRDIPCLRSADEPTLWFSEEPMQLEGAYLND